MEDLQILDQTLSPMCVKSESWCLLKPDGNIPEHRVGHTALYLHNKHKLIIIGGATPDVVYQDVWFLDVNNLKCSKKKYMGKFEPLYEFCAFVPQYDEIDSKVWIFAGANMRENKNDLWEFNVRFKLWLKLGQDGSVPPPRTFYTTTAVMNHKLYVFGGGKKGPDPVLDSKVYQLDLGEQNWTTVNTRGSVPAFRQGHVLVSICDKLFCHGGVNGSIIFDDLYSLDQDGVWEKIECSGAKPEGRAAHGAVAHCFNMYIFGGLGKYGTFNDLWKFNTRRQTWEEVLVVGAAPPGRLDFAMAVISLPLHFCYVSSSESEVDVNIAKPSGLNAKARRTKVNTKMARARCTRVSGSNGNTSDSDSSMSDTSTKKIHTLIGNSDTKKYDSDSSGSLASNDSNSCTVKIQGFNSCTKKSYNCSIKTDESECHYSCPHDTSPTTNNDNSGGKKDTSSNNCNSDIDSCTHTNASQNLGNNNKVLKTYVKTKKKVLKKNSSGKNNLAMKPDNCLEFILIHGGMDEKCNIFDDFYIFKID